MVVKKNSGIREAGKKIYVGKKKIKGGGKKAIMVINIRKGDKKAILVKDIKEGGKKIWSQLTEGQQKNQFWSKS